MFIRNIDFCEDGRALAEKFVAAYRNAIDSGFVESKRDFPFSLESEQFNAANVSLANLSSRHSEHASRIFRDFCCAVNNPPADGLILAIVRYEHDPGVGMWLKHLLKGTVSGKRSLRCMHRHNAL